MVFVFIELIWYINWFSDFKPTLHYWDISHSAVVCSPFCFAGFHLRILTVLLLKLHISLWLWFTAPFSYQGKPMNYSEAGVRTKGVLISPALEAEPIGVGSWGLQPQIFWACLLRTGTSALQMNWGRVISPVFTASCTQNRPWVRVEEENSHLLATYVPDLSFSNRYLGAGWEVLVSCLSWE